MGVVEKAQKMGNSNRAYTNNETVGSKAGGGGG